MRPWRASSRSSRRSRVSCQRAALRESIRSRQSARSNTLSVGSEGRHLCARTPLENTMAESVYKVIELVGTSTESWEKAAAAAIKRASKTLRDLRVAEVKQLDIVLDNGKIEAYRAKINVSFKYEDK